MKMEEKEKDTINAIIIENKINSITLMDSIIYKIILYMNLNRSANTGRQ